MERVHGKILTWTFKGEIYIRKGNDYAPRIKITSADDLTNIKIGRKSIDPPENSNNIQSTVESVISSVIDNITNNISNDKVSSTNTNT